MNRKLISYENLRNWSFYESNLINYPAVGKYLKFTFKNWVENLDQPLAIPWLRDLLDNNLSNLETKLFNLSQIFSQSINAVTCELTELKSNYAFGVLNKIFSLNGELLSLYYLTNFFSKIEKIKEPGDFLCNNSIYVSVKTKSDMNFNLDIISNYLAGLFYIQKEDDLTDFKIQFSKSNGINDHFRNSILEFLNNNLLDTLKALPDPLSEIDFNPIAFTINDISVKVEKYLSRKRIKVDFEFSSVENKRLNLTLTQIKENPLENKILLLDTFRPDVEKYQLSAIKNSIIDFVNKFDVNSREFTKEKFWGVINAPVPIRLQKAFLDSKQSIESELKSLIGNREYKIVFYFYPAFLEEMKTEHIYEFN
jgi:hypothetical protein